MALTFEGFNGNKINATTDNEMQVALTQDITKVGSVGVVAEIHDGSVGVERFTRPMDVSADYRLRVGQDSIVHSDNFSHTVLNTDKYKIITSSMTAILTNNTMVLNAGGSTTSPHVANFQTFGYFPLYLSYTMNVEMELSISNPGQTGCNMLWGLAIVSGTSNPTDGVYFSLTGNSLEGIITNNSISYSTGELNFAIEDNVFNHYLVLIHNDECQFWIDDICYGKIKTPNGLGSPMRSMSCPLSFRVYNSGTPPLASKMQISNVLISNGDMQSNKPFSHIMSSMGNHSMLMPDGTAKGSTNGTGNYINSTAPVSATLSNTASGYTTLGGQFQFLTVAGAETDYALFGFQVPLGTSVLPGKDLIISRITISSVNMVSAIATTCVLLQWGVGVGGSAVSLATADSSTTGGRASKRLPLGFQYFPIGAVVGQPSTDISVDFNPPICCEPGSFLHIILRVPIATAGQTIRGIVSINGHFE